MTPFLDKGLRLTRPYPLVPVPSKGILPVRAGGLGGSRDFSLDMSVFILDTLNSFGDSFHETVFVSALPTSEDCLCKICLEFVKFLLCSFHRLDRGYPLRDRSPLLRSPLRSASLSELVTVLSELNEGDLRLFGIDRNLEGVPNLTVSLVDFFPS